MKIALIFKSTKINGMIEQVFVEAQDEQGRSINVGEWAADGEYESLTIDCAQWEAKQALAEEALATPDPLGR